MTIPAGTPLFRYDLIEPPKFWSKDYKNPQYIYPNYGPKNSACLFFFYMNATTAINVGNKARGTNCPLYFTECELLSDVDVLDLSNNGTKDLLDYTPEFILDKLFEADLDVLISNFYNYLRREPFTKIAEAYTTLKLSDCKELRMDLEVQVNSFFFTNDGPFLGQHLSDFNNGIIFNKLLTEKGYDGYLFSEEIDAPTLCLLSPDYLSEPRNTII